MDNELERLVDGVWLASLDRMIKKDTTPLRPSLGDHIDLLIPQTRALFSTEANPKIVPAIYYSVYNSAKRNSYVIMKKLGMPADYFWKFEYWPQERAYETLRKVINRVFTTIMNRNKEGGLELKKVDTELIRFTIDFHDCVECAGITAEEAICFYHSATFAGIMAALLNREMDAYETSCQAKGDALCTVVIGKRDDAEVKLKVGNYLKPAKITTEVTERLVSCLEGKPLRSLGNQVNIGYYQLMLLNSVMAVPGAPSSFDMGKEYGTHLASVLATYYRSSDPEIIKKYYNKLQHLDIKSIQSGPEIEVTLAECAELGAMLQRKELLDFLFGELQGLLATFIDSKLAYKASSFENGFLKVKYSS